MKAVTIVKLGGNVVAPKDWKEQTIDATTVTRLCAELSDGLKIAGTALLVVVGSGNFGHAAVKKYGINTPLGISRVQNIARGTGAAVTQSLLDLGLPATLIAPHDIWPHGDTQVITQVLTMKFIPVLYGDVVLDTKQLATIYSGEICITKLIPTLLSDSWKIRSIIQAGKENGVLDTNQKVIPEISNKNWNEMKSSVGGSPFTDVTGGMLHKVTESLAVAEKYHLETLVINGAIAKRLHHALLGKDVIGTRIIP